MSPLLSIVNKVKCVLVAALLICAVTAQSQNNYAMQFDGSNNYITLPASSAFYYGGNSVFTFESACYYTGATKNSSLFGKVFSRPGTAQYCFIIDGMSQKLAFFIDDFSGSGWQKVVTSNRMVPKNKWFNVALIKTAISVSIVIDGVLDATGTIDFTHQKVGASTGAAYIANSPMGTSFAGMLDDIRFWNTEITANVIKDWMNQSITLSHPFKGNLVAYYRLNENGGNNIVDASIAIRGNGSPLNASITNNPVWVTKQTVSTNGNQEQNGFYKTSEDDGKLCYTYATLVSSLTKTVQDQQTMIEEMEKKIKTLESVINYLSKGNR